MDKYEYQVVMLKIQEIEQEQLSWMEYVCDKLDYMVDVQKENVRARMQQLWKEKKTLNGYIKEKSTNVLIL